MIYSKIIYVFLNQLQVIKLRSKSLLIIEIMLYFSNNLFLSCYSLIFLLFVLPNFTHKVISLFDVISIVFL